MKHARSHYAEGLLFLTVLVIALAVGLRYMTNRKTATNSSKQVAQTTQELPYPTATANSQFISQIANPAIAIYQKSPRILPSIVIGQAILESNFGTSKLYLDANNPFGVKGTYNGSSVVFQTLENINGKNVYQSANFRKYPTVKDAVDDYYQVVSQKFITQDNIQSYRRLAEMLQNNGYATDPNYAKKLIRTIVKYNLSKYDIEAINQ